MAAASAAIIGMMGAVGGTVAQVQGANRELDAANAQANSIIATSNERSERKLDDTQDFIKKQRLAFLKSGVAIEGSPLLILADTLEKGKEDAAAIRREGLQQATSVMATGRARVGAQTQSAFNQGASQLANVGTNFALARQRSEGVS